MSPIPKLTWTRFVLAVAVLLITTVPTVADETAAQPRPRSARQVVVQAFADAGMAQLPVFVMLSCLAALSVVGIRAYRREVLLPEGLRDQLELVSLGHAKPDMLQPEVDQCPGPLASIVRRLLTATGRSYQELLSILENSVATELEPLSVKTGYIDALYGSSTLVGLLAAVIILIDSFGRAGGIDAEQGPEGAALAAALSVTATGIGVAVLARMLSEYLRQRHRAIVTEFVQVLTPLVDHLCPADLGRVGHFATPSRRRRRRRKARHDPAKPAAPPATAFAKPFGFKRNAAP